MESEEGSNRSPTNQRRHHGLTPTQIVSSKLPQHAVASLPPTESKIPSPGFCDCMDGRRKARRPSASRAGVTKIPGGSHGKGQGLGLRGSSSGERKHLTSSTILANSLMRSVACARWLGDSARNFPSRKLARFANPKMAAASWAGFGAASFMRGAPQVAHPLILEPIGMSGQRNRARG